VSDQAERRPDQFTNYWIEILAVALLLYLRDLHLQGDVPERIMKSENH
jgi:hypothetical protein